MNKNLISKSLPRLYLVFVLVALIFPLIGFSIIGGHSRYAADDYQYSSDIREFGFLMYQVHWYQSWTGRFAFIMTTSLIYSLGPIIVPLLPLIALALLSWGWFRVFKIVGQLFHWGNVQWFALSMSFTLILSTFASLENIRQVLFWPAGIMNYVLPMILLPYVGGSILSYAKYKIANQKPPRWIFFLVPTLTFLAGAYSEAFSAPQILLYFSLYILCYFFINPTLKKDLLRLLGMALIAAILSLLIVISAPGNAIRQSHYPSPPSLFELGKLTIQFTIVFLKQQSSRNLVLLGLAFFFPWFAIMESTESEKSYIFLEMRKLKNKVYLFSIPLIGLLLIASSFSASAWGTSTYPGPRTLSITQYILSATLVIFGIVAGRGLRAILERKEISFSVILLCTIIFILGPMKITKNQYLVDLPVAKKFSQQWDLRDELLHSVALEDVDAIEVLETINYYDLEQLLPFSPNYQWINSEMARYYEIPNISLDTSKK